MRSKRQMLMARAERVREAIRRIPDDWKCWVVCRYGWRVLWRWEATHAYTEQQFITKYSKKIRRARKRKPWKWNFRVSVKWNLKGGGYAN